MAKKINNVLKEALLEAKPSGEELKNIESQTRAFLEKFSKELKKSRISAEIFIGGSFAKKTLIKKEKYDIDVFVRFDRKYVQQDISGLTHGVLKKIEIDDEIKVIHGSRDYFKIYTEPWLCFEIVPTIKVSKPKDAENITDLSYYHVKYINKKVKKKLADDIILAKSFLYANRFYGAESHIKGFSGYSLELLIYYYRGFLGFLRGIAKSKDEKIIIDIEKDYSNKRQVLMDMNSSKLESPIILVDPTFRQRNALATLSQEVFKKFREKCREFLKNPDIKFFKLHEIDFKEIEKSAKKKGYDSLLIRISTEKQEGAVAGSKLLKFYNHFASAIGRYFEVKDKVFYYKDEKDADCFFAAKKKEKIILRGPPENKAEAIKKFRKKHKKIFVKSGSIYAEEKIDFSLKRFLHQWKNKNSRIIREMYISEIKILR